MDEVGCEVHLHAPEVDHVPEGQTVVADVVVLHLEALEVVACVAWCGRAPSGVLCCDVAWCDVVCCVVAWCDVLLCGVESCII